MSNEAFVRWARRNNFDLGSYSKGYHSISTRAALEAWQARQPEIDALIHDNGNMRKAITEYEKENTEARAIINELRVLIQNSLTVDRNAPIWEMVKEFDRKYGEAE